MNCISMCYKLSCADPSELVSGREKPGRQGRAIRVYGGVNLYLTILDNLLEIYLVGIQSVTILSRA